MIIVSVWRVRSAVGPPTNVDRPVIMASKTILGAAHRVQVCTIIHSCPEKTSQG